MKKILIALLILLIVSGASYFLLKNKSKYEFTSSEDTSQKETITVLVDPALYENEKYTEASTYATFDVTYPSFKNAPTTFNTEIENTVLASIRDHKEVAKDTWEIRGDDSEKFPLEISWTPVQVNKNYISFLLRTGGYTGGAHGYENLIAFNYDLMSQKEIELRDLFPANPDYLKTISQFARKELRKQFKENTVEDMLLAGTEPDEENFKVFTVLPDSITFYFGESQVAPFAQGSSKVTMPR